MSLAAAVNRGVQRNREQDPPSQERPLTLGPSFSPNNMNNHAFLDEARSTPVTPSSPEFSITQLMRDLSLDARVNQHSGYPASPSSLKFQADPPTPKQPPASPLRNYSVPTSFMRHRLDLRVSYIDSLVSKAAGVYALPTQSVLLKRNSQNSEGPVMLEASKRKSFSLLQGSQDPHHASKVERLLEIPAETPQELVPIMTLFNLQQARVYHEGSFVLTIERTSKSGSSETIQCIGTLSGNELAIWDVNKTDLTPIYVNVADAQFTNNWDENTLRIINTSTSRYIMRFADQEQHREWFAALILLYFEYSLLHEAYTGALLLAKAIKMSDIKTILAETRYSVGEWCNMRLNYLSSRWIRVYVVVYPRQKDNPGKVSVYSSDKVGNKKNLIMDITRGFSCVSAYPPVPEAIDSFSELKVEGEITVHNWKFLLSKGVKSTAMLPPSPSYVTEESSGRSRSLSLSSLLGRKKLSMSLNSYGSTPESTVSVASGTGNPEKFVSSLYLIPESHPGVANFETMVRLLIPLFDAFELYGRPKKLQSNRMALDGLLFALPLLPKSRYLDYPTTLQMVSNKLYGVPMARDPQVAQFQNRKLAVEKKNLKKRGFLGKLRRKDEDRGQTPAFQEPDNIAEFTCGLDVTQWGNREWVLFLKHELKYMLLMGYDGAGHLTEDFKSVS